MPWVGQVRVANMVKNESCSPEVTRVEEALEELNLCFRRHGLFETAPEVVEALLTLHARVASLSGDNILESYWNGHLLRFRHLQSSAKDASTPPRPPALAQAI